MSRIAATFDRLRAEGRTALIPYITAGDPHPDCTVAMMHALVEAGADLIELGVPFSDPMADGPVIQKATERALAHGTSLAQVLEMVETFRQKDQDTPIVLMGYDNPVEAMGYAPFALRAREAGVDGVLTVDMPPEEAVDGYLEALAAEGLDRIFLVAPTTPESRLQAVEAEGSGFVYYVSLKGVTGADALDVQDVAEHVAVLKRRMNRPVGIGFGIRDGERAYEMARLGDAVIVGSALVREMESMVGAPCEQVTARLKEALAPFRAGVDRADREQSS
ncbi:tryptophan synthase subunit alpha [Sulfurivirga sp.]|uniref:tryptophan synthase subunit alpha n=1 Tax=Sulfurivirga sp. TaxID=2614236 RepID=UPI0025E857B9|nr:tryptophan synthase subunit alpha [Sulfurivirga sp.]